jgi:gamma-glutamylputrescine oxidase
VGADNQDVASLRTLHQVLEKKLPGTIWSQVLDEQEATLLTSSAFFKGGLFVPNDAVLSPFKLVHTLASLCERNERRILTNAVVENITQTQTGINVHVRNRGVITTKHIVYCTGVYTGKVVPGVNKFLLAHKQHVIVTERLSEKLLTRLPRAGVVFNDIKIKTTDDRVLVQGFPVSLKDKFYDGELDIRLCEKLRKVLRVLYPEIGKTEIQYVWTSINCSGIDGLPICGEIHNRPREYVNIGFGASNLNCIMLASAMVKDMIVGNEIPEQLKRLFDPRRINNV